MKTLYLVRHAKSSWKHPELDDFERPLNKRGKRDAPAMGYPFNRVAYSDDIYEAGISSLFKILSKVENKYNSGMIVGHNPGMTYFANTLASTRIDNIPTCGIFCTDLDISSWQKISENCGVMKFFKYPKNL